MNSLKKKVAYKLIHRFFVIKEISVNWVEQPGDCLMSPDNSSVDLVFSNCSPNISALLGD